MPDQEITCVDCGRRFSWSSGEQRFYRERGLQAPRRCPDCRGGRSRQAVATQSPPRSAPQPSRPLTHRRSPQRRFGVLALLAAIVLGAGLLLLIPATPLQAWLIGVNLAALLAYGYDKAVAGSGRTRVPEAVLLGLALIGGSPGAFVGMLVFRHKTSKPAFLIPFALIALLQLGLLAAWPLLWQRL
jgi:uncharacterized membrane protein YsdA (DUF1294 family)